jgi:hypothetical protein
MPHDWVNRTKRPPPRYNLWKCLNCGVTEVVHDGSTPEPDRIVKGDLRHTGTCEEIIVSKINGS